MRLLFLACLLALCSGCAWHRSEGAITARYHGVTVVVVWREEARR